MQPRRSQPSATLNCLAKANAVLRALPPSPRRRTHLCTLHAEGLPDFFRQDVPGGELDDALDGPLGGDMEDDLGALTFGGGFEVTMEGLPELFALAGEPPTRLAAAEHDELAAITGDASASAGDAFARVAAVVTVRSMISVLIIRRIVSETARR